MKRRRRKRVVTGFDPPKAGERLEAERVMAEVERGAMRRRRPERCQGYGNACHCKECEFKDLFSRAPVAV
jgi:hypothetical protein